MAKIPRSNSKPSSTASVRVVSDAGEGNSLFEALVCEFHWTALQIGAITSCMNASVAQNRSWMLRSCSNFLPVESPVVKAALHSWLEIGLAREIAASIHKIYKDLADAKRVTSPIILDAGSYIAPATSISKLEQILALWRKLAEECEATVQALEPEARWRLSGLYTGNSLLLGKFLREAISGAHDCVNQIGEVAIPVLPQRRRSSRYILLQPCLIRRQSGTVVAIARDISMNGIGLGCEHEFQLKERVLVELRDGRKMKGTVVWSRNKQVNVQFDEPLSNNDPLFEQ